MKRDLKNILPTIAFVLVVAIIFVGNSFVSNKLYNIIPTYKEQPISYKDERQLNINNDSFIYEHLMFDMIDIKFSNPTEQEYKDILRYMLDSNLYISLMNMTSKEKYWVLPRGSESLYYEKVYESIDYIQTGIDETGEEKYYVFQGYTEDRGFIGNSLVVFSFSFDTGIEQFVCIDDIESNNESNAEMELEDISRSKLVYKVEEYVELISANRLIENLPELYFSTEDIEIERNICYIRDSLSYLTVYYDIASDSVIGFRRNRQGDI